MESGKKDSNRLLDNALSILEKKSNEAIARGNEFKGFLGFGVEEYSKDDLILLLNVMFNDVEILRKKNFEYEKNIVGR